MMWREMLGDTVNLGGPLSVAKRAHGFLITDEKALYDSVGQGDLPSFSSKDKYTALEIVALSQNLQLADGLTKVSVQGRVRKFLADSQKWNVVYDPIFTAAKKLRPPKPTSPEMSEWPIAAI